MVVLVKQIWNNKYNKEKFVTIPILSEIKGRDIVKVILLEINEDDKMQESDLFIERRVFYNKGNNQKLIRIPARCGMEVGDFVRITKIETDEI